MTLQGLGYGPEPRKPTLNWLFLGGLSLCRAERAA
jgi:hypothetical protein